MALLDMSLAYPAYPDKERAAKETMEMEHLGGATSHCFWQDKQEERAAKETMDINLLCSSLL